MSAVSVPLPHRADVALQHPWVAAARSDGGVTVRVVPSPAGVEALRRHGKSCLVATLHALTPTLPAQPRAWRFVEDLDDRSVDEYDCLNRPRLRRVERIGADAMRAALWVPYDLRVFDGHFDGVPLLPGVTQLAWAADLAHAQLAGVGRFCGVTAAKFRRLVRPGTELDLALRWMPANRELAFEYRHADSIASSGRVRMTGAA